jgi:hypothetical protein
MLHLCSKNYENPLSSKINNSGNNVFFIKLGETRAKLSQNKPFTKAFDRDVGIIDMHIGNMLWAISGYFIIFSDLDLANINRKITCVTLVVMIVIISVTIHQ